MLSAEEKAREIREAVEQLRQESVRVQDAARERVASRLEMIFSESKTGREVRVASREALRLYQGGMASFQDVGHEEMWLAVERLRRALRRGAQVW